MNKINILNNLIRNNLSLTETKLLNFIIQYLHKTKDLTKNVVLQKTDIKHLLPVNFSSTKFEILFNNIKTIKLNDVEITILDNLQLSKNTAVLTFNQDFLNLINLNNDEKKTYTKFNLDILNNFKCKHAYNLYTLIKSKTFKKNTFTINFKDIVDYLNLTNTCYSVFKRFNSIVLNKVIDEINSKTDINISCSFAKKNTSVNEIVFLLSNKTITKKNIKIAKNTVIKKRSNNEVYNNRTVNIGASSNIYNMAGSYVFNLNYDYNYTTINNTYSAFNSKIKHENNAICNNTVSTVDNLPVIVNNLIDTNNNNSINNNIDEDISYVVLKAKEYGYHDIAKIQYMHDSSEETRYQITEIFKQIACKYALKPNKEICFLIDYFLKKDLFKNAKEIADLENAPEVKQVKEIQPIDLSKFVPKAKAEVLEEKQVDVDVDAIWNTFLKKHAGLPEKVKTSFFEKTKIKVESKTKDIVVVLENRKIKDMFQAKFLKSVQEVVSSFNLSLNVRCGLSCS